MEKQRKYKLFSIIALTVAICGMSLGFAAFSKVLTITASATVTPNEEDFKVVTYGFKDGDSLNYFLEVYEFSDELLSDEAGVGYIEIGGEGDAISTTANITNNLKNTTINNINVTFKDVSIYKYVFILKNEGKYDAYINLNNFSDYEVQIQYANECIGVQDQTIINEACKEVQTEAYFDDFNFNRITGTEEEPYYKLSVGEYVYLNLSIAATTKDAILSEEYNINFKDLTIEFSTAPYNN